MLAAAFLLLCASAVSAQPVPVTIMGVGGSASCGTWTQSRSGPVTPKTVEYAAWVFGFLSGMSVARMDTALNKIDSGAVLGWMDNYCRQNPLQSIMGAANALDLEIAPRRP
jgi:hypothetical protein